MRVALVGKVGSIIHWLEDCAAGLRAAGHEVLIAATRNPAVYRRIEDVLLSERLGAPMAQAIARRIARFAPAMILVIGAWEVPLAVLQRLSAMPGRGPLAAWIGDAFEAEVRGRAALFDLVGYTDSGLLARHREWGFGPAALFAPHAADPAAALPATARRGLALFIANPTPLRREVVAALDHPIALYGPGWGRPERHETHGRKVPRRALAGLYAGHVAALNIRNERNILVGLNQRSFDPCVQATPVLTDPQPDLEACFDPTGEVVVWRDAAELNDAYARLRRDPAWAARVGEAGRARVMAQHTFGHRLAQFAAAA